MYREKMKKIINKVQISVHKVLYKGHEGEELRPEIYSEGKGGEGV